MQEDSPSRIQEKIECKHGTPSMNGSPCFFFALSPYTREYGNGRRDSMESFLPFLHSSGLTSSSFDLHILTAPHISMPDHSCIPSYSVFMINISLFHDSQKQADENRNNERCYDSCHPYGEPAHASLDFSLLHGLGCPQRM